MLNTTAAVESKSAPMKDKVSFLDFVVKRAWCALAAMSFGIWQDSASAGLFCWFILFEIDDFVRYGKPL